MKSEESHHGDNAQASITETWDRRDPNPDPSDASDAGEQTLNDYSADGPNEPEDQKSKGVAIAQNPQSTVNSNGVVLPYTREQLKPIETWGGEITDPKELDDLFPASSEPQSETDSKPATPTSDEQDETEDTKSEESTETERERSPIKPVSTHAKKAAQENRERFGPNTEDSPDSSDNTSSDAGVRVRTRTRDEAEEGDSDSDTVTDVGHDVDTDKTPTGREMLQQDCPECGSSIVAEGSDQYCSDCGLLLADQQIDPGPEWRAFDHQQQTSRSRVGGPVKNNIHDKGLSTVIGNDKTDANGKPLTPKMKKKMARLRKWDSRFKVKNTKERNLRQAFGEIQRISSEMDLPEYVEETACTVYRRALDEELLPGRSIEAMASASVYIAVRQASIPKTLDHLVSYCRVDESRITGAYSYLGRELGIEIQPPEVLEYLSRVASELDVSKCTEHKAEDLLQTSVEKKLHSGKAPSGMAAAAVYAATMITRCDRVTQEDACEAGDVCELTIRTRHRELLDAYGIDHEEVSPPSQSEVEEAREELDVDNYESVSAEGSPTEVTAD